MEKFHNIPNYQVTDTDGNKHWISPSISVDALLVVDNKVLITKRSAAPEVSNKLKWCLPCGFMDFNESPSDACIRELYEETGVDVREHDLLNNKCTLDPYDRPYAENGTALQFIFRMEDRPAIILNKRECLEYRWVTVDELEDFDFAFGHDYLIRELV